MEIKDEDKSPVFETRLAAADALKSRGNEAFQSKDYNLALTLYRKGLFHVHFDELSLELELLETHRDQLQSIRLPILLNCCACLVKLKVADELTPDLESISLDFAKAAAEYATSNPKVDFRYSQLLFTVKQNNEQALEKIKAALKVSPNDRSFRQLHNDIVSKIKEENQASKQMWRNVLSSDSPSLAPDISCCDRVTSFFSHVKQA